MVDHYWLVLVKIRRFQKRDQLAAILVAMRSRDSRNGTFEMPTRGDRTRERVDRMDDRVKSAAGLNLEFLAGGGDMGGRIRAYPWARTPLGEPGSWPQGLRTAVRVLLTTQHPMFIFWGLQHTCLYNDAYCRSLGPEKHPSILGAPGRESWEEIWPIIGPQIEQVMRGEGATWHENQLVPIIRHGQLQDVYWTYGYSPIDEPAFPHGVGGVLVVCTETTEQVLAQQRLLAERERFVQLFDQAPTFLALLQGREHVIELANPGYLKLIGDRPVVGRKVADALPDAVKQGYLSILDEVYRTGKPFSASGAKYAVQASPEGPVDERYVDFVYQPIANSDGSISGILVQGVDVTARTESDRALALNRARLGYATRLSGVGFWYCDLPFEELQWDERVKDHFFFEPTTRITIDDFYARIHPEDRIPTRDAIDAAIRNQTPYDIVYRTVHPSTGAIKWIRALGGTDYASDGTPTHFDGVTVDVSPQKLDQQRLSSLNRQLTEQDRLKDEFLATLAHELRNPLAPIRTGLHVLRASNDPEQQAKIGEMMERQIGHLVRMVDDLLDISRVTLGKITLKKEHVDFRVVLHTALETTRSFVEAAAHELAIRLPSGPLPLEVDPTRIAQVIANIVNNAAKYTSHGGRIQISAEASDGALVIRITDSGLGIPADMLPKVFDMFMQVERPLEDSSGGLGIGLALVRKLVELHGGSVEAESPGEGQGSTFTIRLPLAASKYTLAARAEPARSMNAPALRILIVDDNLDAAASLAMCLELEGHQTRRAHDGAAALALALEFQPQVAILDIELPGMNGYQLASALRGQTTPGLRPFLIAVTGRAMDEDRHRARDAGFDLHLAKPIDPQLLKRMIIGSHDQLIVDALVTRAEDAAPA
jgi:signal transduction histidine kinase/CheY-like chemotaxis protein